MPPSRRLVISMVVNCDEDGSGRKQDIEEQEDGEEDGEEDEEEDEIEE